MSDNRIIPVPSTELAPVRLLHPDVRIAPIVRGQHGVLSHQQAIAVGFTQRQIDHRVRTGRWIRLTIGVYALATHPATWRRQVMAAVLAERRAVASGRSAEVLHDFPDARPTRPEITVPRGANHRNPLATVHQSDLITVTKVDGIPTTTVEQTVVDLAATVNGPRLATVVDDLVARHRVTIPALSARYLQLARTNRAGLRRLRDVLLARASEAWVPPASVLEGALYQVLRDPRLPEHQRQPGLPWLPHDPRRIDAIIRRWMLILEADGRTWHSRAADFARDRRRDQEAMAHGYAVLRFGWEELIEEPLAVLDTILDVGRHRSGLWLPGTLGA